MRANANRSEVWIIDFAPVTGHEQGGNPRPAVIMSVRPNDLTEMAIVVPSTRTRMPKVGDLRGDHFEVKPDSKNGLTAISYFMCEQVRAVSTKRFGRKIGQLSDQDMYEIEERLIELMGLGS